MNWSELLPYILICSGLFLIFSLLLKENKSVKLKRMGQPAEGIVFQGRSDDHINTDTEISYSASSGIVIRFVTQSGEWITAPIDQPFFLRYSGQYREGDRVLIYYNASSPTDFYVDTKQSEFMARVIVGIIGGCALVAGFLMLLGVFS